MPGGGQLTIGTRNVRLGTEYAQTHHGVTPGDYRRLCVGPDRSPN